MILVLYFFFLSLFLHRSLLKISPLLFPFFSLASFIHIRYNSSGLGRGGAGRGGAGQGGESVCYRVGTTSV